MVARLRSWCAIVVAASCLLVAGTGRAQFGFDFPTGDGAFTTHATRDEPLWEWFTDYLDDELYGPLGSAVGMLVVDGTRTVRGRTQTLRKAGICTATLIAGNRALTNAHCLVGPELSITNAWLRMDFHSHESQITDLAVSIRPIDIDYALDYAVLEVLDQHEYAPVPLNFGAAAFGESLFIIHHSAGEAKRISRRDCSRLNRSYDGKNVLAPPDLRPRDLDPSADRFHFCDTLGGSSGSLVFADQGGEAGIVGLHFAGAMKDRDERTLPEDQRVNLFIDIQAILGHTEALQPRQPTGTLTVVSNPPTATVTLNGGRVGTTPLTLSNVTPGTHAVRLGLDGFLDEALTVTVRAGEVHAVDRSLVRLDRGPVSDVLRPDQEAELLRRVAAGGRVELSPGTFRLTEGLVVDANLEIVGAGREITIIQGSAAGSVLHVTGTGTVTLMGLTIEHVGEAASDVVWIGGGATTELRSVTVQGAVEGEGDGPGFGRGVVVYGGATATLRDVLIRQNQGLGLEAQDGGRAVLHTSEVSANQSGLSVSQSGSLAVRGSRVERNRLSGIHAAADAGPVTIDDTIVASNRGSGIIIRGGTGHSVSVNTIEDNQFNGVFIHGSAVVELRGNTVRRNASTGISFADRAGGTVTENLVIDNGEQGIAIGGDAGPTLEGNLVQRNATGISFYERGGGIATDNRVEANRANGIAIVHQAEPTLRQNILRNNAWNGIAASDDASGRAIGNTIDGNRAHGIYCADRATTALIDNTLSENSWYGYGVGSTAGCVESGSRFARNGDGDFGRVGSP